MSRAMIILSMLPPNGLELTSLRNAVISNPGASMVTPIASTTFVCRTCVNPVGNKNTKRRGLTVYITIS